MKLAQYVKKFSGVKILVIGDIMVDKFIYGSVSRISPEAPVPVVEITRESYSPGGAANVASNIVAVGGKVSLLGVVGFDSAASHLISNLEKLSVDVSKIVKDESRPTIMKTRIIAHHQQVVRVDKEVKGGFSSGIIKNLIENFHQLVKESDAVIISDYGKGVISPPILKEIIPLCRRRGIPITVDPKIEHFLSYKKVTCLTPNLNEATEGIKATRNSTEEDVRRIGIEIMKKLQPDTLIITRGEKGMTLFESASKKTTSSSIKITDIPTRAKEVYDVTGAGDTVISVLTLALASGAPFYEAAEISNYAAGVVVGKLGTATCSAKELLDILKEQS